MFTMNWRDGASLRAAFEEEYREAIQPRLDIRYFPEGIKYDLDDSTRKPQLGALVVIAAILEDEGLFGRLVAYKSRLDYDHWEGQRDAGVSREDAGQPETDEQCARRLAADGLAFLGQNVAAIGPDSRRIEDLIRKWS